jgi:aminoglycoside phosphotransferase (APT) family kinase protein
MEEVAVKPETGTAPPGVDPPGVDPAGLAAWLTTALPAPQVPRATAPAELTVTVLSGGRSNLTYQIVHSGQTMVLRRPPLGHVLATAHDMAREYRVLSALAGTPVPVPRTLAYCADQAVIGAPFYLMEKVDGAIYRTAAQLGRLTATDGDALATALAGTLAALHAVDPQSVGLADFGRPEGFLHRQIRRWRAQLEASYTRALPGAEELATRLAGTEPTSPPGTVVHGDYRLDNVLVAPAETPRINAVLDWEMSTLGDPLTDLGMTCVYWDGLDGFGVSVPPAPGTLPGWPSRAQLVERYARHGAVPVDTLDWYIAFAYFKLAVILEGIYCRHAQGLTVGEGFDNIGAAVPELIARGLATAA